MYDIFLNLLKEHNVKASDVSKATGISPTVFSEWKKGKSNPKIDKLQKIASYFGVSVDYLTTGDNTQGNEFEAKNTSEREMLLLCRKVGEVSEEDREQIINQFKSTIDIYLKAKGIKGE